MTLKIAGRVVGGLHQRPEYNIPLKALSWRWKSFRLKSGRRVNCRRSLLRTYSRFFSTDFERERWVVKEGDSEIEIALDRGEVKAGEHQNKPICELELELLSGNTQDILTLARGLLDTGVLRQKPEQSGARLSSGAGQRRTPADRVNDPSRRAESQRRTGAGGGAGKRAGALAIS